RGCDDWELNAGGGQSDLMLGTRERCLILQFSVHELTHVITAHSRNVILEHRKQTLDSSADMGSPEFLLQLTIRNLGIENLIVQPHVGSGIDREKFITRFAKGANHIIMRGVCGIIHEGNSSLNGLASVFFASMK